MNAPDHALDTLERAAPAAAAQPPTAEAQVIPPDSPARVINRELSWLDFNHRVVEEAENARHPLLERVRFVSISASNLDEFYSVRVAGLIGQAKAGLVTRSPDGRSPAQQLAEIRVRAESLLTDQQRVWGELRDLLRTAGIEVCETAALSADDVAWLDAWFMERVFPVLTPLAIDPAHPFPFIPNMGLVVAPAYDARRGRAAHARPDPAAEPSRAVRAPARRARRADPLRDAGSHRRPVHGPAVPRLPRHGAGFVPIDPRHRRRVRGGSRGSRPFLRDRIEATPPRGRDPSLGGSRHAARLARPRGRRGGRDAGRDLPPARPARHRRHQAADCRRPAGPAVSALHAPVPRAHPRFRRGLLRRDSRQGHHRPPSVRELRRGGAVPPAGGAGPERGGGQADPATARAATARSSRR